MTVRHGFRFWVSVMVLGSSMPAMVFGQCIERGDPPKTERIRHIDDLHGVAVPDPYRWLEDLDSDETAAWVEAQNLYTFEYLGAIPQREEIGDRLTQLWNYEKVFRPTKNGKRYFFLHNDGLQNQDVLFTSKKLNGKARVLLDPNSWAKDGTVALSDYEVSPKGKWVAYGVSSSGSDWKDWKVRNVKTGKDLPDLIQWTKFSTVAWTKDGKGFFYSRYEEPSADETYEQLNMQQRLYFHELGTDQSQDKLIFEKPDQKKWGFSPEVSHDGRFLVVSVWRASSAENGLLYLDLKDPKGKMVEFLVDFDASYNFVGNRDTNFYVHTTLDAPFGRVTRVDAAAGRSLEWSTIVPQEKKTVRRVQIIGGKLVVNYLKNANTEFSVFTLDGKPVGNIDLPGLGSARISGGEDDSEAFFSFQSFSVPQVIYRVSMDGLKIDLFEAPTVDIELDDFVTEQVFYESKDGTKIPMFISHQRDLELDGENPTYLYGYGGFNISLTPRFRVERLVWMEMGGIWAVANLRGGGEFGEDWHEAGTKHQKQNVFDDFIAAGEWLIDHQYTSKEKLAIAGGSNGGLLVGACLTQRPDLYAAALPGVGVMDMLRFHKFTIGWAWVSDFGSPDDADMFPTLYAYSPYHNLKLHAAYPATLITTSDHDDRVVPSHSFKFAAALQAAQAGDGPILIRIETKAGHGAGKPLSKKIEEIADKFAFLVKNLEMDAL